MSLHHLPSMGFLSIGCTLTLSTLGLVLALCWAKISRLKMLLRRREQRINRLLTCDHLTSLSNRESFLLEGEQLLLRQSSLPGSAKVALISLGVDNLKRIHSEFGHQVVTELLQQIARRLRACTVTQLAACSGTQNVPDTLAHQDTECLDSLIIARVCANEFALLIPPLFAAEDANAQAIEQLTRRLLAVMHQPFLLQAHTVYVRARSGIAWATQDSGLSQLLFRANTAATTVKARTLSATAARPAVESSSAPCSEHCQRYSEHYAELYGEHYAVFHAAMETARVSQLQLKQALAAAVDRQELRVRYQPIVDLETGKTSGFEALVRWQHPELGLLNPNTFLPLAEEMGLSVAIDRWVFECVCQQLWQWQAQRLYPSVSVNLSGAHLSRPDVVEMVEALLVRYPINPAQLTVEVTESVMVANQNRAIATLERLRQIGLRVSLDDFGTGYCSLTYLSQFPVDIIKIDRSFVSDVGQCDANQMSIDLDKRASRLHTNEAIVQSVLTLADALEIQVVAEGIEHSSQCRWLKQRKCAYGQGNFFAEAITGQSAQLMLNTCSVNVA